MTEKSYFFIRGYFDSETESEIMGKLLLEANSLKSPFRLDVSIPTEPKPRRTLSGSLLEMDGVLYTGNAESGMSYGVMMKLLMMARSYNLSPIILNDLAKIQKTPNQGDEV